MLIEVMYEDKGTMRSSRNERFKRCGPRDRRAERDQITSEASATVIYPLLFAVCNRTSAFHRLQSRSLHD